MYSVVYTWYNTNVAEWFGDIQQSTIKGVNMTNMRNDKIEKTGSIGERLVLDYLLATGEYDLVESSSNKYDMHKDLIAIKGDKRTKIEVKVRTVIRKHYAMPLGMDQWYKVDKADRFFFVTNPTSEDEPVTIYEARSEDYRVIEEFGPNKQRTRMYDLDKMKKINTISDPEVVNKLYSLSVSKYKQ